MRTVRNIILWQTGEILSRLNRGFHSIQADKTEEDLTDIYFDIIKAKQIKSKNDGKMLQFFLIHLVKCKKSKEILNLKELSRTCEALVFIQKSVIQY